MKVIVINQEPLEVTPEQASKIMNDVALGAERVIIRGEMVKASVIVGIRNDVSGDSINKALWGQLPAGRMKHFYDERREQPGEGYKKFLAMKSRILAKS